MAAGERRLSFRGSAVEGTAEVVIARPMQADDILGIEFLELLQISLRCLVQCFGPRYLSSGYNILRHGVTVRLNDLDSCLHWLIS